jgi:outer membrane protein assembly complex protein YaeT
MHRAGRLMAWRRGVAAVAACLLAAMPLAAQGRPREDERLVVRALDFTGNRALSSTLLEASIVTTKSAWFQRSFLRFLDFGEKRRFDEEEFVRDVLRLRLLYRVSGFPDAVVDTTVTRDPARGSVYVAFRISEGEPVVVTDLTVTGLDSVAPATRRLATLDLPLVVGAPFDRLKLQAAMDTITRRLRSRGYPEAEVFREFTADVPSRRASVTLNAVPGSHARFSAVRVEGARRVDTAVVRTLLGVRAGDPYSELPLLEGQRFLYRADLFRFASVSVDSAARQPGDTLVPLVVRVTESPARRARGGVGFGTTDCFRGSAGLTVRNFLGGGRLLDVTARASKLGVGSTDLGLDRTICSALQQDSVGSSRLNYNVQASYKRPGFLAPANSLTLAVFSERRSEFGVYLREDLGAALTLLRDQPRERVPISLSYAISYGRTEALPAAFCQSLASCTPEIIGLQRQRRVLGTLTATFTLPRANNPVDPTRGSNATFEVTRSDTWLGSSRLQRFTRLTADAAFYRPLTRAVTVSWRLRGGAIFAPQPPDESALGGRNASFVPLEQRFFGGGPNDVRGFQRNELGPVVYVVADTSLARAGGIDSLTRQEVRFAATGGNTVAVGNLEVRFPSPVFTDRMRLAAFVDAGAVWSRGVENPEPTLRLTPGAGLRFATPLGPLRFDVAYNPNPPDAGRLFVSDAEGQLNLAATDFRFRDARRFTFHVSVGQPF